MSHFWQRQLTMWQAIDFFSIFLHQLTESMCTKMSSNNYYFHGIKFHSRIGEIMSSLHHLRHKPQGNNQTCGHIISLCRTNRDHLRQSSIWTPIGMRFGCVRRCIRMHCTSFAPFSVRSRLWQYYIYAFERKILIVFTAVQYLIFSFDFIWHDKPCRKKNRCGLLSFDGDCITAFCSVWVGHVYDNTTH